MDDDCWGRLSRRSSGVERMGSSCVRAFLVSGRLHAATGAPRHSGRDSSHSAAMIDAARRPWWLHADLALVWPRSRRKKERRRARRARVRVRIVAASLGGAFRHARAHRMNGGQVIVITTDRMAVRFEAGGPASETHEREYICEVIDPITSSGATERPRAGDHHLGRTASRDPIPHRDSSRGSSRLCGRRWRARRRIRPHRRYGNSGRERLSSAIESMCAFREVVECRSTVEQAGACGAVARDELRGVPDGRRGNRCRAICAGNGKTGRCRCRGKSTLRVRMKPAG